MDKEKLSTQSLVFGILSLVFTECSILGIIFGAVGKSKAHAAAEGRMGSRVQGGPALHEGLDRRRMAPRKRHA